MTHRELCILAAKYLRNKGIVPFHRCQYVVCELERAGESPDAYGFGGYTNQLIEVKVSRSDFLADKKKRWRKFSHLGIANYRSYLCPAGLIQKDELPEYWGLLWIYDDKTIEEIRQPSYQESNKIEEFQVVSSILRREGVKPQIFSYKQYKNEKI